MTTKNDLTLGVLWQEFNAGPGRAAIAALFTEFDLYSPAPPGLSGKEALRREGQRDVLLRIVQLLGLKGEKFPAQAWDDTEILDRMMRQG